MKRLWIMGALACMYGCGRQPGPAAGEGGGNDVAASPEDASAPLPVDTQPQSLADAGSRPSPDTARKSPDGADAAMLPAEFLGASRCQPGWLLCEDFETGTLDPAVWQTALASGSIRIETTKAARGQRAAHVRMDGRGEHYKAAWLTTVKTFPVAGNDLFIRAFVYIEGPRFLTQPSFLQAIEGLPGGGDRGYILHAVDKNGEFGVWFSNGEGEPTGCCPTVHTRKVPLDGWSCWEWELRGKTKELFFWVDDQRVAGLSVPAAANWIPPDNPNLQFGIKSSHEEPNHLAGFNVWIDEIVISNQKVGCVR